MTDHIDYGDDGSVSYNDDPNVEQVIDDILEYVEGRFDVLDKEDRQDDLIALCQEFLEWGAADQGDDIGYMFLKYHEYI